MNCRKCGNLLNENEVVCRVCGESLANSYNMNGVGQNMNQQAQPQQYNQNMQYMQNGQMPNMQQPMYGMPNNSYNQSPKNANGVFVIIVVILLVAILGVGGVVGSRLLSNNDTKQSDKSEDKSQDKNNKKETEDKKDDAEEKDNKKENDVVATNVYYYDIAGYKFPVPKELIVERDADGSLIITDNSSFQMQFGLAADSYTNCKNNPEVYKKDLESMGATITDHYERKYAGKNFYIFKVVSQSNSALFYLTEIDDGVVGIGIIMATSLSSYEKGLNYVSKMVSDVDKASSFAPGERPESKINIDKDVLNNSKIESIEYTG